jgi:hypothetical protein
MTISFSIERLDEDRAHFYLSLCHPKNRPIDLDKVNVLIEEIKGGRWRLNNHLIAFDRDGYLVDGQHRLCAIGHAGVPVEVAVMWGVEWHE